MHNATDIPGPRPFSKSFGEALSLLFIPHLLAFFFGSYEVLRFHIGYCFTPTVPIEPLAKPELSPDPLARTRKRRTILAILVFSVISVLQLKTVVWKFTLQDLRTLSEYIIYFFTLCVLVNVATRLSRMERSFMYRTSVARRWFHRKVQTKGQKGLFIILNISIVVFSLSMIWGLSSSNNTLCICAITMAFVFPAGRRRVEKRPLQSMTRLWALCSFMYLSAAAAQFFGQRSRTEPHDGEDFLWTNNMMNVPGFAPFLPAALTSACTTPLIVRTLRIDFDQYFDKERDHLKLNMDIDEPAYPVIQFTGEKLGRGIGMISGLFPPFKFPKPYFTVALLTWSFIRIATIVSCITTGFPAKSLYDACFLGIIFEYPIVLSALLLLSFIRKKGEKLWNYDDAWPVKQETEKIDVECGKDAV